ncbi:GDSL-type esterase/lipase family protein [uncultured Alistipes sp.]|jgi:sialate-O-acetyltransferase|uniref:GDSL-type esterase/lipase family protein n=1 Tax=uncultured Alistipes sp. TaxID=538949 RepID=UPI0025F0AF5A|nr:GDSL-type esterase/lipase family protein [uncultured Alistipes sp.]
MRRTVILLAAFFSFFAVADAFAQKFHNAYYDARRGAHDEEGLQSGAIVFVGNSITEQGWWRILLKRDDIENRGIGGDNTFGMIDRLPDILKSGPRKIFLMAGINDLTGGQPVDTILMNIAKIADMVHADAPQCELYIQSVLPVNVKRLAYPGLKGHNPKVRELNAGLATLCSGRSWCTFVNLVPLLSDTDGELRADLTKDGIHLHPEAYVIWTDYLKKQKYLK